MDSTTPSLEPDSLVNDVACQMAASRLSRRLSRSSGSQVTTQSSSRRSVRVEKPRSNHNSPRFLERRKTTSSVKKHVTLDDHFRMMFGICGTDAAQEDSMDSKSAARPLSWHPTSTQDRHSSYLTDEDIYSAGPVFPDWNGYQSTAMDHDGPHSGLSDSHATYSSFSSPQLANYTHLNFSRDPTALHACSNVASPAWERASTGVAYSELEQPSYFSLSDGPTSWQRQLPQHQHQQAGHSPAADFLPIQRPAQDADADAMEDDSSCESDGKELVGMGLYDPPEAIQSWLDSGVPSSGKGLKLEETWEPPEDKLEDGEDDADADEGNENDDDDETPPEDIAEPVSSDDESLEEPQSVVAPHHQQWSLPTTASTEPSLMPNLAGHSFFLDEDDDTYAGNGVWLGPHDQQQQQLKQQLVQDAAARLSYGWI